MWESTQKKNILFSMRPKLLNSNIKGPNTPFSERVVHFVALLVQNIFAQATNKVISLGFGLHFIKI